MNVPTPHRAAAPVLALSALIVAACGTGSADDTGAASVTGPTTTSATPTAPAASTTVPAPATTVAPTPATSEPRELGSVSGGDITRAQRAVVQIVQVGALATPDGTVESSGSGSGFIIDPSGIAVTNNHVAAGAASYAVYVDGETEPRNARLLALSECADLAVIDIEGDDLPYVEFWDGDPAVGTPVLSGGFPLGDPEFTLTRGIISKREAGGDSNWASVEAVLEHDARIRPGNSGGPLLTEDGYVVGVNYAGNGEFDFNFAIEAQYAIPIIEQLRVGDPVEAVGLNAEALAIGDVPGLWVYGVDTGSPADRLGIEAGDFVTRVEGVTVGGDGTMRRYCDILRSQGIDQPIAVEVLRPSTGEILDGNLNGDAPLEVVFSPSQAGAPTVAAGGDSYVYSDFVTLTDDTGLISIQVPAAFTDILTAPLDSPDYGTLATILAAEDLSRAIGDGPEASTGNGAAILAFTDPGLDMVTTLVDVASAELDACDLAGDPELFEAGGFEGVIVTLVNCSANASSIIYVGAQVPGESRFVVVGVQAVDEAMVQAIPTILTSFRFLR